MLREFFILEVGSSLFVDPIELHQISLGKSCDPRVQGIRILFPQADQFPKFQPLQHRATYL